MLAHTTVKHNAENRWQDMVARTTGARRRRAEKDPTNQANGVTCFPALSKTLSG